MAGVLRSAAVLTGFSVAYALSVLAGRATRLAGGEVALVWPAAAVGIIWMLTARRSSGWQRGIHVAMLGVLTFWMNIATGAPPLYGAWFSIVNVTLAMVAVGVLTHRCVEVVLRDPADLARLVVAVTAGACCAAALVTVFLSAVGHAPVMETFALFAVRNGVSGLLGVAIWLRIRDITWRRPQISPAALVEAVLVGAGVVLVFVWTFWLNTGLPLAFITLVPAMWLALRYNTTVSTMFLLVAGSWIIFATLMDRGVFVIPDVQIRALLSQAMVISLALVVLTLSLYRDSRALLIAQLKQSRDEADHNSALLGAVLDSIHDSVVVVDAAGDLVLQNSRATESGLAGSMMMAARLEPSGPRPLGASLGARRDVVVGEGSRVVELATAPLAHHSRLTVIAARDVTVERRNAQALREARDLFASVLQAASEQAIIGTDPAGRITVFNNGAVRMLGWSQDEMLGRTFMDFHYAPEVNSRAADLGVSPGFDVFVRNVSPGSAEVREWTLVRRDGTHLTVSLAVSQMTNADGSCAGYIGVATDITERKLAEQALGESEERFRLAFDTAPMGMFMFEIAPPATGRITRCNKAMADLLGRSMADVLRLTVTDLAAEDNSPESIDMSQLLALSPDRPLEAEMAFARADGRMVWGAVSASVVAPGGSSPYGMCLVEDITSRRSAEAELHYLASHDRTTGLANRALFIDLTERTLASENDAASGAVGLVFLDLDGFKAVNDTWGHAEGDEVLRVVGGRIQRSIGPRDTAARIGGDEFAVLSPGVSDLASLREMAECIRRELSQPVPLTVGRMYDQLSVSIGAVVSHAGCTAESLLQRADMLMYHAKRGGKNCVVIGEPSEEAAMMREVQMIRAFDRPVNLSEFVVHFQPVVNLRSGDFVAAEALLRWQHPQWGLLTPDEFLAAAEASPQMIAIGRHVLYEACRSAQGWTGPMAGGAVHVNVSGRQLQSGDLAADTFAVLAKTGLSPDRLVLELTETHAGAVADDAKAALEQLRRIGVRVAIDDVGTGFSGLVKIIDLPIDVLKIDKQFVGGLPADARCAAITKAVLSLGTSLGLSVIAEGIERRDQCDLLSQWGCGLGQGFLFGHATADGQVTTRR